MLKKRSLLVPIVIVIVATSGVMAYRKSASKSQLVNVADSPTTEPSSTKPPTVRELLSKSRDKSSTVSIESKDKEEQKCIDLVSQIQQFDLSKISSFEVPEIDCVKTPSELDAILKFYKEVCAPFFGKSIAQGSESIDEKKNSPEARCYVQLYFMRAGLSTLANRDRNLSDLTDSRELAERMIYEFGNIMSGKASGKELTQVAERLLEIDPKLYGAAKASIMGDLFAMDSNRDDPATWDSFQRKLSRLEGFDRDDPDLQTLREMAQTHGYNPAFVRTTFLRRTRENPSDSRAWYLLAHSYWKTNERERSRSALQKAINGDPQNREYQDVMRRISQSNATPESFQVSVNVGMSFDSILN